MFHRCASQSCLVAGCGVDLTDLSDLRVAMMQELDELRVPLSSAMLDPEVSFAHIF